MEFHLAVTNSVGGLSAIVNGLFVVLIFVKPPDNLGIFRSQYYAGAIANFLYAATQFWTALVFHADGTIFLVISGRNAGAIPFLLGFAAVNWQFMMLSSNLAARYAAIRGGWIHYYLANKALFYTVQLLGILFAYIPPIILISPSPELRNVAQTKYCDEFNFDFQTDYYFGCTYEHPILGNLFIHQSIFLMGIGFQGGNLFLVLVFGAITYLHISKNTQSTKLREVNNRLLRARCFQTELAQACFSFLFLFMPGLVINTSMLLRIDSSSVCTMLSSMMSLGTLFNPFVDITLTPGYRKRITRMLLRRNSIHTGGELTVSTVHPVVRNISSKTIIVQVK